MQKHNDLNRIYINGFSGIYNGIDYSWEVKNESDDFAVFSFVYKEKTVIKMIGNVVKTMLDIYCIELISEMLIDEGIKETEDEAALNDLAEKYH